MALKLMLNPMVRENFKFICPTNCLVLDLINPVGIAAVETPAIRRGINGKTLVLLEGELEKNEAKKEESKRPAKAKVDKANKTE